jgi:uncharacterized membrane protein YfcA
MTYLWLILAGVLAGITSGIFGIGGGIILVPIFVTFFGMTQAMASGTSLVALLMPVGALGVWEYYRSGRIGPTHIVSGLIVGLGLIIGAYIGARISMPLSEVTLKRSFALFLVLVAAKFWFSAG